MPESNAATCLPTTSRWSEDTTGATDFPNMVGDSAPMQTLRSMIETVGPKEATVMIHGESGSGKELVARSIHAMSKRADGPFVPLDCTTLRDTLFESQLFGHVKGAFTGADKPTLGFVRSADGGTLFLDEVGELDLAIQAKLLRCIQERCVVPLGSTTPIPVNVRIVTATHRDLAEMVREGTFREDLYYRLHVVQMPVPALRERREDITHLAEFFLEELGELYGEPVKSLSTTAIAAMTAYHWPGNVRELANAMEHAMALCQRRAITAADLPDTVQAGAAANLHEHSDPTGNEDSRMSIDEMGVVPLEVAERKLLVAALKQSEGNQAHAARLLQVERRRLYRMVKRFGLANLTR